jgi:hypothetical protein
MIVYLVISPPKIPTYTVNIWFWPTLDKNAGSCFLPAVDTESMVLLTMTKVLIIWNHLNENERRISTPPNCGCSESGCCQTQLEVCERAS